MLCEAELDVGGFLKSASTPHSLDSLVSMNHLLNSFEYAF